MSTGREGLVKLIQDKYPGYHPIVSLAEIAHDEDTSVGQKIDCHKTVLKYVEPELKSVEVKGEVTQDHGTLRVIMETPPSDIPTELPDDLDGQIESADTDLGDDSASSGS